MKARLNTLQNGLLAKLNQADQALIAQVCEPTVLQAGDVIGSPTSQTSDVYFPMGACVAMFVKPLEGTQGLAVGLVGSEGAVGMQHAFSLGPGNITLIVQSSGNAFRTHGLALSKVLKKKPAIMRLFSTNLWSMYQEVASFAALSHMQDIKARMARWLVLSSIRSNALQLKLTHAYIAKMLGVTRSSVTLAAVELKEQGVISYSRGYLKIINAKALKTQANWTV